MAVAATAVCANSALAATDSFGSRTLKLGMRGADVSTLQQDLTTVGLGTAVTGNFDLATKRSVITFQRRNHIVANGIVGTATVIQLETAVSARALPAATAASVPTTNGGAGITTPASATPTPPTAPTTAPSTPAPTTTTPGTAPGTGGTPATGGATLTPGPPTTPAPAGYVNATGLAVAPSSAPLVIQEVVNAGNQIAFNPYIFGGGHGSFTSRGYDCSGSVSFALHGAGLLASPLDSTQFEHWGSRGPGRWITLWANGGHVYMEVAGLWFDTAAQSSSNRNDRWSPVRVNSAAGYVVRHPTGW